MTFIDLLREMKNPIINMEGTALRSEKRPLKLFKTSLPVCHIARLATRNDFTKLFLEAFRRISNFTFRCPIRPGKYYIAANTTAFQGLFPLKLIVEPNMFIQVHYRFYEETPKKNFTYLANQVVQYVIKTDC